ncbi:MAG: hypothetical protein ACTSX7_00705, partial [Alphaproteobacteria bacterium]
MTFQSLAQRTAVKDRLQIALDREELKGLRLGSRARLVTMAVIAVWLGIQIPLPEVPYFWVLLCGFVLAGWLPYEHRRRGKQWRW